MKHRDVDRLYSQGQYERPSGPVAFVSILIAFGLGAIVYTWIERLTCDSFDCMYTNAAMAYALFGAIAFMFLVYIPYRIVKDIVTWLRKK